MSISRRRSLSPGLPARLPRLALALAACGFVSLAQAAEDFATFKMTVYEGHVSFGGLRDDR